MGPRTCILTKGLVAYSLPQFGDRNTSTICLSYTLHKCKVRIVAASINMPIDSTEEQLPSTTLEQLLQTGKLPLIVACDTNAHHPAWGCADTNYRGKMLSDSSLEVVNVGNEDSFCVGNVRSITEATLVSRMLSRDISIWHVSRDNCMSDHRTIQFSLKHDKTAPISCHNIKRTNWCFYYAELCASVELWFRQVKTPVDVECK